MLIPGTFRNLETAICLFCFIRLTQSLPATSESTHWPIPQYRQWVKGGGVVWCPYHQDGEPRQLMIVQTQQCLIRLDSLRRHLHFLRFCPSLLLQSIRLCLLYIKLRLNPRLQSLRLRPSLRPLMWTFICFAIHLFCSRNFSIRTFCVR